MPKEITHILIAQDIRSSSGDVIRQLLTENSGIYLFGSTAPDLFYYDVSTPLDGYPSSEGFGELLHGRYGNKNNEHIFEMLKKAKSGSRSDRLFAFVAGYLTHVAADTIFHPLIYSATGDYFDESRVNRVLAQSRHRILETGLDLHMLSNRGMQLSNMDIRKETELPGDFQKELLDFYFTSVRDTYDSGYSHSDSIHRAFKKARMMSSIMLSPVAFFTLHGLNRMMKGRLDFFVNLIYTDRAAQRTHSIFSNPGTKVPHPVTGKLAEFHPEKLAMKAMERGVEYVSLAYGFLKGRISEKRLRKEILPLSLNNGMPLTPNTEMKHYRIQPGLESYLK